MQLKRLQLLGFKTFADKTEIEIDAGLTAIVGPNGSGKSNIVDALLWVLGEQNPRFLRGASAQDVIFAGTDKRKPLGMAEVRLTIDNADGTLPVKFVEVVVTRRVYRSGESQYLINNSVCRMRDIVEMFLDTGVGKGAYAFVSQSEIDAVLSARPEDRRELFEEAAGIKKYRVKKREALRKLESAEANLNRVRDILRELDVQREPMELQAQTARRYMLLQERLHEIEVGLLVAELHKADYELFASMKERIEDTARLLQLDADMAVHEQQSAEINGRLADAENETETARLTHQAALSLAERTESRVALTSERSRTARLSQTQLAEELGELGSRIERLKDSMVFDREDRDTAATEEAERREEWAARKSALVELEQAVRDAMREAQDRQGDRTRMLQERARKESALKAACDRLVDSEARRTSLLRDLTSLGDGLADAEERAALSRAALETHTVEQAQIKKLRDSADADYSALQTAQAANRLALDAARRTSAEQSARLTTLTELQENHEGFYQGVRAVLNAARNGHIRGHYRAVVDLLEVPERIRVAVEVALGGGLQDIVTETEGEAKTGIQWLKQNRAGRATFLPLPLLRPGNGIDTRSLAADADGLPACAADLVSYDRRYSEVARLLLGRVAVVSGMDSAISISRRLGGWSKIVTLEGELLTPGGALTGGSLQGRGAHLVGRKGEMDDMKVRLPQLRAHAELLNAEAETKALQLRDLEGERETLARQDSAVRAAAAAAESARSGAVRECERMTRDRADLQDRKFAIDNQITHLKAEVDRLTSALDLEQAENDSADDALASLSDETRSLAARRDETRAGAVAMEVEVSRLREKREGLTRSLASDQTALDALQRQGEQKAQQQHAAASLDTESSRERDTLAVQLVELRTQLEAAEKALTVWRDRRQALMVENQAAASAIRAASEMRVATTKSLHDAELRIARLEVQSAQVTERLRDEYGLAREEALALPDDATIDRNTAMEVGRLRRELRAMGTVNTGAVAEYERLTERHEFLTSQAADLEKGRGSLLETIAEIDESTRGVFMETFEAVRVEFEKLFVRLFEGGSTKLILTAPDDLLETGIEVVAQPPGKKAQLLSLLSGGERALTATALLFAFLAVKPSPFVLLDEVDAPLDGANVEKFTRLVKEFSARSQFLLITHNPVTMESAPSWYGVTMKEPGVSSILAYRVPTQSIESEPDVAVVLA